MMNDNRKTPNPKVWTIATCVMAALVASCSGGGGYSTGPSNNPGGDQTVASVAITGNVTSVAIGATVTLGAAAYNAAGSAVSSTFSWSSSNQAVATIGTSTGTVTGVTAGVATITVTGGGKSATRVVTVSSGSGNDPAPLAATVSAPPGTAFVPDAVTIGVGGTVTWVFGATTHNVTFSGAGKPGDIQDTSNASVSRTFSTTGVFTMTCTIHAGMTGTVTVQ